MEKIDKEVIITIIKKHLPRTKIYLFGSRARGDASAESDFDIALDNQSKIDEEIVSLIKEDLEESTIPFTVDIVDLQHISQTLKNEILKDGKLWN